MNITAQVSTNHNPPFPAALPAHAELRPAGFVMKRANTGGRFTVMEYGVVRIEAEAGLLIRVHGGCLWVPHDEDHCSVGVGAGEQFVVRRAGLLTTLAARATQVEFVWLEPATVGLPLAA